MGTSGIRQPVDFGVITIREDEYNAVLERFSDRPEKVNGRRVYNIRSVGAYTVAVLRCVEQGVGEAQNAARDLLEELDPRWLLVVGIAGGVPASEFTLGDVVVSTRIHDFTVEAVLDGGTREYALAGGPVHLDASKIVADLPAMKEDLGRWNEAADLGAKPGVVLTEDRFYGDLSWRQKARETLRRHFAESPARPPLVTAGAVASSDRLVKDVELLKLWLTMARQVLAIEMESAGVYRATFGRNVPVVAIRGISDIVGFKREPEWTAYACRSAAAFAHAFLRARPIGPRIARP